MKKFFLISLLFFGVACALGYGCRLYRERLPDPRLPGKEIEAVMKDPDSGLIVSSRMPALIERDKQIWSVLTIENTGIDPLPLAICSLGVLIPNVRGGGEKPLLDKTFVPQLPSEITLKPGEKQTWKMSWILSDYEGKKTAGYLKCEFAGFVLPPGMARIQLFFSFFSMEDVKGERVNRKTLVSPALFLNLNHEWLDRSKVSSIEVTSGEGR